MLASHVLEKIRALLKDPSMSQRKIALSVGVSRGTVWAIATGRRAPRRPAAPLDDALPILPTRRCPGCGSLVRYYPCLICRAQYYRREWLLVRKPVRRIQRRGRVRSTTTQRCEHQFRGSPN